MAIPIETKIVQHNFMSVTCSYESIIDRLTSLYRKVGLDCLIFSLAEIIQENNPRTLQYLIFYDFIYMSIICLHICILNNCKKNCLCSYLNRYSLQPQNNKS